MNAQRDAFCGARALLTAAKPVAFERVLGTLAQSLSSEQFPRAFQKDRELIERRADSFAEH